MILMRRVLASLLVVSMGAMALPSQARAAMVATESLGATSAATGARERVAAALAREDVRTGLAARGVRAADVQARVDALSDAEVAQLAQSIDRLPAGGLDVLGALVLVFIVLVFTDILGLTKVFPFTRPIR